MTGEGVGSHWPFASGRMVDHANLLLSEIGLQVAEDLAAQSLGDVRTCQVHLIQIAQFMAQQQNAMVKKKTSMFSILASLIFQLDIMR